MKIWLDDIRTAPEGYVYCKSVNETKTVILANINSIELIDCDHDLGDYASDGGDGIKLLDWLVENHLFYPTKLHTMNPVGRDNMQQIIDGYWRD